MKKSELQQIIKEEISKALNENRGLPKVGDKVLDSMNDEYEVIKITPNKIILKPLTFKGDNSIYPQDFTSSLLGRESTMEDFWSWFNKTK
jgi:hypothetical protein